MHLFTIRYSGCTFKQVNVLRKVKCTLCKQTIKYISYYHRDNIRICLRGLGWVLWTRNKKTGNIYNRFSQNIAGLTQFTSTYCLSYEIRWEYLSSRRKYRNLTTFYKMHNILRPQYLRSCLPPTLYHISDHNLRNDENYATP